MTKRRCVAALVVAAMAALGGLAGCGSDASAGVFMPNTPTPAALRQVATPVPTATTIPADA